MGCHIFYFITVMNYKPNFYFLVQVQSPNLHWMVGYFYSPLNPFHRSGNYYSHTRAPLEHPSVSVVLNNHLVHVACCWFPMLKVIRVGGRWTTKSDRGCSRQPEVCITWFVSQDKTEQNEEIIFTSTFHSLAVISWYKMSVIHVLVVVLLAAVCSAKYHVKTCVNPAFAVKGIK